MRYSPRYLEPDWLPRLLWLVFFSLVASFLVMVAVARADVPDAGFTPPPAVTLVQNLTTHPDAPVDLGAITTLATGLDQLYVSGDHVTLVALILLCLVFVLMKFVKPRLPIVSSKIGGIAFTAIVSVLLAVSATFLAHGPGAISQALLLSALKASLLSNAVFALWKAILDEHFPKLHDFLFPESVPFDNPKLSPLAPAGSTH